MNTSSSSSSSLSPAFASIHKPNTTTQHADTMTPTKTSLIETIFPVAPTVIAACLVGWTSALSITLFLLQYWTYTGAYLQHIGSTYLSCFIIALLVPGTIGSGAIPGLTWQQPEIFGTGAVLGVTTGCAFTIHYTWNHIDAMTIAAMTALVGAWSAWVGPLFVPETPIHNNNNNNNSHTHHNNSHHKINSQVNSHKNSQSQHRYSHSQLTSIHSSGMNSHKFKPQQLPAATVVAVAVATSRRP